MSVRMADLCRWMNEQQEAHPRTYELHAGLSRQQTYEANNVIAYKADKATVQQPCHLQPTSPTAQLHMQAAGSTTLRALEYDALAPATDGGLGLLGAMQHHLTAPSPAAAAAVGCLQVFLELQLAHGSTWLQQFLLESEVPPAPKKWGMDMLAWVLETAAKRCSRDLVSYISQWLQMQAMVASGTLAAMGLPAAAATAAGLSIPQVYAEGMQAARQGLPPLAQAVLSFVEHVVELIRSCVPQKRASSSGGAAAIMVQDMPEVPSNAARVLLRYAALGPWAAAHLMQVRLVFFLRLSAGLGGAHTVGCGADGAAAAAVAVLVAWQRFLVWAAGWIRSANSGAPRNVSIVQVCASLPPRGACSVSWRALLLPQYSTMAGVLCAGLMLDVCSSACACGFR